MGQVDSYQSCPACHNVHGTNYPKMTKNDLAITYGSDEMVLLDISEATITIEEVVTFIVQLATPVEHEFQILQELK